MIEENSVSDIEVDIEDPNNVAKERITITVQSVKAVEDSLIKIKESSNLIHNLNPTSINSEDICCPNDTDAELLAVDEEVLQQLMSLEEPKCELLVEHCNISNFEKFVNKDYFRGRPAKTPERYLKIRNHILSMWSSSKPFYVTKTSVRTGLKHCGDVNSISRIHQLLEQIGAINFGCTQLNYIRPLCDIFLERAPTKKDKVSKLPSELTFLSRSRFKRKFTNDGEGGRTLIHNEKGEIVGTHVFNEEPATKFRLGKKTPTVKLIFVNHLLKNTPQPYGILLHVASLLLMDFHAHLSRTEVMGLLGGSWDEDSKQLLISRYVPCRNVDPSATHCDMCPISQAAAANVIHDEGLSLLGWFHSHPTFVPEPSQQDLDTQFAAQQWISTTNPYIGLILSPFTKCGVLTASPYRCFIADKGNNSKGQYVPYKFKTELDASNLDVDFLLNQARQIYIKNSNENYNDKIDFEQPYFLDSFTNYFDKFISSVKMRLAKCADINELELDSIVSGLTSICVNKK